MSGIGFREEDSAMETVIDECDICGKKIPPVTVNEPCIVTCAACSEEISGK